MQDIQARRNALSKEIGQRKSRGEDASAQMAEVARSKEAEAAAAEAAKTAEASLDRALALIPNIPLDDVPDGDGESGNVVLRQWGETPAFAFPPLEHFELGERLRLMDFDRAAKLSGARFVVLTGALARLERALAAFMLDLHTGSFGYTEVNPPAMVRDEVAFGTGQLPKFADDLFRTTDGRWLIPTAEVPLTNLVADEIVDEASLPLRMTAMTWCFRAEAGRRARIPAG